ncbi:hypothetical protein ACXYTP_17385 [Tsukamurella ocularis]|uniref:hypothetical protein n=1 Tax=Tsukamurella ocularis TaxID=1970234 RepID=UPI0039EFF566
MNYLYIVGTTLTYIAASVLADAAMNRRGRRITVGAAVLGCYGAGTALTSIALPDAPWWFAVGWGVIYSADAIRHGANTVEVEVKQKP